MKSGKCEKSIFNTKLSPDIAGRIVKLLITIAGTLLMCIVSVMSDDMKYLRDGRLTRPSQGTLEMDVNAKDTIDGTSYPLQLEVKAREYTPEETQNNFSKLYEELCNGVMLADNESLERVSTNLNLPSYSDEYEISLEWYSGNYNRIAYDGAVNTDGMRENEHVELTLIMKYKEISAQYIIDVNVCPPENNPDDTMKNSIRTLIQQIMEDGKYESEVMLPSQVDGHEIEYEEVKDNPVPLILIGGAVVYALLIAGEESRKRKAEKERIRQMQYDYSEVVSKLTLLIGAGMSVQKAWEKIAADYKNRIKEGGVKRYAYEEMIITYNQLQTGIPERTAYSEFGRRCKVKEYRKLGTLLEQNVRKGTKGLSVLLEQESAEAFEQRKNYARQLGEEAGTKLLLPMILMLVIVMVIVMVPAVMSFQI